MKPPLDPYSRSKSQQDAPDISLEKLAYVEGILGIGNVVQCNHDDTGWVLHHKDYHYDVPIRIFDPNDIINVPAHTHYRSRMYFCKECGW